MSILLEALRKTEKNQHLRETPTIHTENQPDPVSDPLPTRWLILLLVVALFVAGWFVWRQYQQPAGAYQPPVTLESGQLESAPVEPVQAEPVRVESVKAPATSRPAVTDQPPVETVPTAPKANTVTGTNRTPVESYEAPSSDNASSGAGGKSVDADHKKTTSDSSTNTSQTGPKQSMGTGFNEPAKDVAVTEPVESSPETFHPGEPAPISYWELPDSVRSDIPEIKFSVLVYSVKPADRFVLINGQRLGEGDTAQPGLVVKEIRRDGVIFSYRLYQFLVEK